MATVNFYSNGKWFAKSTNEPLERTVKAHKERFGDGVTFSVDGYRGEYKSVEDFNSKKAPEMTPYTLPRSEEKFQQLRESIRRIIFEEYDYEIDSDHADEEDFSQQKKISGKSNFKDIDWTMLHETLLANKEYRINKKIEGNPNYIQVNTGDFFDSMISPEDLSQLENFDLVETVGAYPEVSDEYLDYNTFYNKAKEIWDKEQSSYNDRSSEAPFLRGREEQMDEIEIESDEQEVEEVEEADTENDCFISDVVRGGYDVSCAGKFVIHVSEYDDAVQAVLDWQQEKKWFPTIWFVNERGSVWAVDDKGNEIK